MIAVLVDYPYHETTVSGLNRSMAGATDGGPSLDYRWVVSGPAETSFHDVEVLLMFLALVRISTETNLRSVYGLM
jgi:hypothetical protein